MANHGAKFASVNLNKSYGQQHHSLHHSRHPHLNGGSGSYEHAAAAGRGRVGGGSSGGMLVLSRNRGGAPKVAPKLSVPPPLNLPSLRKEHEKFDASGPGGPGASTGTGSGSRPSSSGVGWSKPIAAAAAFPEKNESNVDIPGVDGMSDAAGASRGVGSYVPPSARSTGAGLVGSGSAAQDFVLSAEKALLLRGEDFPSLQAARPVSSGASQKQKDGLNQKQKHVLDDELSQDKRDNYHLGPMPDMNPSGQSSGNTRPNKSVENGGAVHGNVGGRMSDQTRKQGEYFSDPLPLVRMNPRSDWADDERDTGHRFVEQGRDNGFSNSESYWDRDFDLPRPSILPHKPSPNQYDRWSLRDNKSSEVLKMDPYNKDVRTSSRESEEVNKRRTSLSKGASSLEIENRKVDIGVGNNMERENKYIPPHYGNTVRDGGATLNRDSSFGRKDLGQVGQQMQRNGSINSFNNRGVDRYSRDRHVFDQPNKYRGDNNTSSRSFIASSGKRTPISDPILPMGRETRFSNSDRPFSEDPFSRDYSSSGFDERDLFSDGLVGAIKRKKDAVRSTDFHDPIRESFEAELERVQKMQELERQKIIEEQERALEQARKEEEERLRRIREEDESRQRLEEEAREAAWRAEQEQLEAIQRAEELRIVREEEKKKMQLEEERRKQAARQMLEELEAKMARRQIEDAKGDSYGTKTIVDEKLKEAVKENSLSRNTDLETWEEGERMVENVMTSGSFESSVHGRPADMSSRHYPPRESSSNFIDRGKSINSWKRDMLEYGGGFPSPQSEQETGHYSPRRDLVAGGRVGPRKEFQGGHGLPSRAYLKAGMQESYSDEFGYQKEQRWNLSSNAEPYGKLREMDYEFQDIADRYGDTGWGQGRTRSGARPPYPERLYPHSDANDLYSYGRSRYSVKQPRVPPPPLVSAQRTNFRGVSERPGPLTSLDDSTHYTHASRTESARETDYYGANHGGPDPSEILGMQLENSTSECQKLNSRSRCDSQSSLSFSNPPTSPPHLSQDELDASEDSPVRSDIAEGNRNLLAGTGSVSHSGDFGNHTMVIVSDSVSAAEDEEWTLENEEILQQQEEYDEDEDGYREEDEVRDRDGEKLELNKKFDGLELEERGPPHMVDNVVLGFDEGVEVEIPSDDTERSRGNHERSFGIHDGTVNLVEERLIVDEYPSDEQNHLITDNSHGTSADSSSGKVLETAALPGSIGQHVSVCCSSATANLVDGTDSSGSACLSVQPSALSSSVDVTTAASQHINLPSVSSAGSQGDLPIKLQFGLFSGPSLIPSPVPAIQIGSIQMPLHIHSPVGPSITHLNPSQPSTFQFGQLQYTSPISQGILPMAPHSMSFVQPNMLGHLNLNQNVVSSGTHEYARDASMQNTGKDEVPSHSANNQPSFVSASSEQFNGGPALGQKTVSTADNCDKKSFIHASVVSGTCDDTLKLTSGSHAEDNGQSHAASKSFRSSSKARRSDNESHHAKPMMQSIAGEKNYGGLRGLGSLSAGRGRRFSYAVKNTNPRSSDHNMPSDSNGFLRRPRRTIQRTEFRIRENNGRRLAPEVASSSAAAGTDNSTYMRKNVGVFTRSGSKRGSISKVSTKHIIDSEPVPSGLTKSQYIDYGDKPAKEVGNDLSIRSQNASHPGEANLRRNTSEEDVDAPLQSGVVRVFKQSGIEAASDEDDFIEVRSKRQMMNDRREQREKEIKAKSRTTKPPRKPRVFRQKDVVSRSNNEHPVPLGSEETVDSQLDFSISESSHFVSGRSIGFSAASSQPPIGTHPITLEAQIIKPSPSGSVSVVSNSGTESELGVFDSKNKVMSLSQTQVDEAMKPARYDSHVSAVGGHSSPVSDPILAPSSILTNDKTFSSGASPINSLLAGEKIQFGAVTSPTILPPSSRVVSHGIGAPGSNRPDVQVSRNFPVTEKDNSLFFGKEKHLSGSCVPLQDCEAEAEAAASAVAVAAIGSDEIVGNGLGSVNSTQNFGGSDIDGITTAVVVDQHMASQSHGEELLSVSLPADLSIETTPISLWPPLPSPQSSTSQMLSHFPAGPPSHFPFYEMNPMLGGPIFAFSPHEESSGTQSQTPKTTTSSSASLGNWQQHHSGVDSFYGPPAGYPGPFIGPPGGIPGVQGPAHMVVYNHFAPVGQYGQVGLSFMGTTYIPSGKQADWKNTASTAVIHSGEGDSNNVNMATVQRSAPATAPIQHLAPGSPLLPLPSPVPLYDVSPFPTASDMSAQARWGHIPASPLHPVSVSRPLQPQVEGALPSQPNLGHSVDQSLSANRFPESRTSTLSDNSPSFTVAADSNAAAFSDELSLVDSLRSTTDSAGQSAVQSLSVSTNAESGKTNIIDSGKQHQSVSPVKNQYPKKNLSAQQGNSTGLHYQRGHMSQRNSTGNELSHRRMGFHGRGSSDRSFPATKMKQIYVAKQTTTGSSST